MASHQQASPTTAMHHMHGPPMPPSHPQQNGLVAMQQPSSTQAQVPPQQQAQQAPQPPQQQQAQQHQQANGPPPAQQQPTKTASQVLAHANEQVWLQLGGLSELMGDADAALQSYEQALRINQWSIPAMQSISCILRTKEQFPNAVEYLRTILSVDKMNGEVWGNLGHCYLMMDDLQQAYSAYQQALYNLQNPKEPKLWYGIGILYDRYGSLEHAEEAFSQVMSMEPNFEKASEIYFRLGIIYKQQQKYMQSLECFKYIVQDPPRPLTEEDIWFQIGHVHEQQKDHDAAKAAYRRVLERDPNHAKVLQQLGWLHHQQSDNFNSQEQAIEYLEKSVSSDSADAQSWYLLGRCYMSQRKYNKAYEAYQQAVYRDGRNPTFWCSIGVLYYQINQYRDALDAYSRAIRLNPSISEVWYDLGTLYESCNNQTNDALDAYQRAAELDPNNGHIKARLQLLKSGQPTNGMPNQQNAPLPQDVHPQAYQPGVNGPPGVQWGASAPAPSAAPAHHVPPPAIGANIDWNRRLADIQNPQAPPQQPGLYDQREIPRPAVHAVTRAVSPRQDQLRPYHEARTAAPSRRGQSPSPKSHSGTGHYTATPVMPPQPAPGPPPPPPPSSQQGPPPQNRIANPNYGGQPSNVAHPQPPPPLPPPPPQAVAPSVNGLSGPQLPPGPALRGHQDHARMASPPPVRPIIENKPPSPGSNYHHQYQHHPNTSISSGIADGAPAPTSALAAAETAARERDERTSIARKRYRERCDDISIASKRLSNDETRSRLDDRNSRRPSPPDRISRVASPSRRTSTEMRRLDDSRRPMSDYHPSDAAHHPSLSQTNGHVQNQQAPSQHQQHQHQHSQPPAAPPTPQQQPPPQLPTQIMPSEAANDDRKELHEPPARKMEVDEDYDDSGEDEKRNIAQKSEKSSPRGPSSISGPNGVPPATAQAEAKA